MDKINRKERENLMQRHIHSPNNSTFQVEIPSADSLSMQRNVIFISIQKPASTIAKLPIDYLPRFGKSERFNIKFEDVQSQEMGASSNEA